MDVTLLRLAPHQERQLALCSLLGEVYLVLLIVEDDGVGVGMFGEGRVVEGRLRNLGSRQSSSPILKLSVGSCFALTRPSVVNSRKRSMLAPNGRC
jgi:hypothetical protein